MGEQTASIIFHITTAAAWAAAQRAGVYAADTLATEGFIHCSNSAQVIQTLNRYFIGQTDLVLLCIDTTKVSSPIKYEPAHGELFPHIYGPFEAGAVARCTPLTPSKDGSFKDTGG